jgi:signal transduction histidine kinase
MLVCCGAAIGLAAIAALVWVRHAEHAADVDVENAMVIADLRNAVERESALVDGFLWTGEPVMLAQSTRARAAFPENLAILRSRTDNPAGRALLDEIATTHGTYEHGLEHAIVLRRERRVDDARRVFEEDAVPAKAKLDGGLQAFATRKVSQLSAAEAAAAEANQRAMALVTFVAVLSTLAAAVLAWLLRRALDSLNTEHSRLEETLLGVEHSNADLDAFAGRVAHDLRNVLAPLSLAGHALRDPMLSPERRDANVARLDRTTKRAVELLDSLLAFSRAGRLAEDSETVASLATAVGDVLEELEPQIRGGDVTMEVAVDDEQVSCPPALLHIVVRNVVGNAVKFVQARTTRNVRITGRRVEHEIRLRIEDSGPGIPSFARQRIFEPFYRVPGSKQDGSGLGLATVRRLLDAYGGRVKVSSFEGEGSTFTIFLPLAWAPHDAQGRTMDQRSARALEQSART